MNSLYFHPVQASQILQIAGQANRHKTELPEWLHESTNLQHPDKYTVLQF